MRHAAHLSVRLGSAVALRARGLGRWLRRRGALRPVSDTSVLPPPLPKPGFAAIDDPDGGLRIVRLHGRTDWRSLDPVIGSFGDLRAGQLLHLDVADADIIDAATMRRLERTLDRLEARRVDVRLVGLDPSHPALLL